MSPEHLIPWVRLLDAVNILAAEDVKKYLDLEKSGKLLDLPKYRYNELNRNYSSAITYFKSTYFKELNDFDGCRIVEQLKQLYK
jgi:hypothetical protein